MVENKKIKPALYIVATPIGNLDDIGYRALETLKNSDYILCEDTRHSIKIFNHYKLKVKLVPFHKHNETKNLEKFFQDIESGKVISLIADAGTPLISDPGQFIVKKARERKLEVIPIPGPSAVIAAVSVSGFNDKFFFFGFLSKKQSIRSKELKILSQINSSIVLYIPARDLKKTLEEFLNYFLEKEILIAREISKIHESYLSGLPDQLLKKIDNHSLKGEVTIVINNKILEPEDKPKIDLQEEIGLLINKMSSKDLAEYLSNKMNISKKVVYQSILKFNL